MSAMQLPENNKVVTTLGQAFSQTLTDSLSSACAKAWKVAPSEIQPETAPEQGTVTCFKLSLSGSVQGEAFLLVPDAEIAVLELKVAKEASEDPQGVSVKALQALLEGSAGLLGSSLQAYGSVTIQIELATAPDASGDTFIELQAKAENDQRVSFTLVVSTKLMASFQATSASAFAYPDVAPSANLDLVLDVALNVTLRFGQRQLSLREVLDLTSGSVVELDRQVDEPVELVLDGRVVARGEAVIIDGNYGMRITQVLQPMVV
jgi:flagellar motor switch protein FliN/FliY